MANLFDYATAVNFIRKLATPIIDTEAYKHGIIDEYGNRTRKRVTLMDKRYWGYMDRIANNIKKLLVKVGATGRIANVAAAMAFLKEDEVTEEVLKHYIEYVTNLKTNIDEDGGTVAVNNVGGGNIAGAGVNQAGKPDNWGEPPVRKKQKNKYQEANKKEQLDTSRLVFGLAKRNV